MTLSKKKKQSGLEITLEMYKADSLSQQEGIAALKEELAARQKIVAAVLHLNVCVDAATKGGHLEPLEQAVASEQVLELKQLTEALRALMLAAQQYVAGV